MRGKPTAILLFALFVGTTNAQTKTDRQNAFLTGPVKEVASSSTRSRGETPAGSGSVREEDKITYDQSGHEIRREMFSDYGFPIGVQTQTYDSDGVLRETIFKDEKGALQERTIYTYDQGKLIQVLRYDGGRVLREKTVRTFDAKGRLTSEAYYDPDAARANTAFSYDDKDNVVEMSFFMADGRKAVAPLGPCFGGHRVVLTYDDKGQVRTKTVHDVDGSVKKSWNYTYNEKGLYAAYSQKSGSSTSQHVFAYEYDAKGNWTKQTITTEEASSPLEKIMLEMRKKETGSKEMSPEEAKLFRDSRFRTTITIRKITYY